MFKKLLTIAFITSFSSISFAENYAVFLHGRAEHNWSGSWAAPSGYKIVDAVSSWDGQSRIDGNQINYETLNNLCSNGNQCVVYSYSTGGLIKQRLQLLKNTKPLYENSFASAGGGSELADACGWVTQWGCYYGGVDDNLKPSWARNGSNAAQHSSTRTKHIAGNGWTWLSVATSGIISGDDDAATGPHSNTGCDSSNSFGLPTDCRYCSSRNWYGGCNGYSGGRKPGHSQWVTGGWHHFNIATTQSSYWY